MTIKLKECPPKIELVDGYGVYITRRALDDAVDSCRSSATRLIRNLISIFFSNHVLSKSNACGKGRNNYTALDQDILAACYS